MATFVTHDFFSPKPSCKTTWPPRRCIVSIYNVAETWTSRDCSCETTKFRISCVVICIFKGFWLRLTQFLLPSVNRSLSNVLPLTFHVNAVTDFSTHFTATARTYQHRCAPVQNADSPTSTTQNQKTLKIVHRQPKNVAFFPFTGKALRNHANENRMTPLLRNIIHLTTNACSITLHQQQPLLHRPHLVTTNQCRTPHYPTPDGQRFQWQRHRRNCHSVPSACRTYSKFHTIPQTVAPSPCSILSTLKF